MSPQIILLIVTLATVVSTVILFLVNRATSQRKLRKSYFKKMSVQLMALIVWLSILGNILMPHGVDNPIFGVAIYFVSVLLGIFLIINLTREIKIQKIVDDLVHKLQEDNERLKKLDEQKTEFVSLASHQLRGPLSVIQGYSSMLNDGDYGKIPEKLSEPVDRIFRASNALGFLINDYLDVSRIERGEMEYVIEDVNLSRLTKEVASEFKIIAKKSGLKLDFTHKTNKEYFVRADKSKMKQILSNLIDNAIKYTKEGEITVSCERKSNFVVIKVQDTGIGLSKKDTEEIFAKFKRAKTAISVDVSGTGLGLFVAKVMTRAQEGEIWVESEGPGKGSAFNLKFPLLR